MTKTNTWYSQQKRNEKNLFVPKWNKDTIIWITAQLNEMVPFTDIQMQLIKDYGISLVSTYSWISMTRRIMKDVQNGLSLDEALERDRERRNLFRRIK